MPAIAAAVALLAVAIAVVAGPSVVTCSQSAEGAVACLGKKLAETGLLPADTEQAAASQGAASAPEPVLDAGGAPAITLLRAEPDGSLVIAGIGSPNAQIETYANGELLGTTRAEPSGDWAVVPEAPLPAGGVEITVGEAGKAPRGEQSFVVVIDPHRVAEPLVVATTPGEASEVLQGLPPLLAAPAPAAGEPAPAESVAPEPAPSDISAPDEPPPTPDATVAAIEAAPPAPAPAAETRPIAVPPTIDAIEIDGTANFFAGSGPEGANVRLYVDDRHVADTEVAGRRWLVEADGVLIKPSQRVRIDLLKPGTADVSARAEVNFVVELPAAEPETAAPAVVAADAPSAEVLEPAPAAVPAGQQPAPVTSEIVAEPATPVEPPTPAKPQTVVAAAPPVDADAVVPTLRAAPVGPPEARRFASGKAIIRHGDNLWTIARRVYGDGLKYTTIYRANQDQIRNPSRIYPGQVFELPVAVAD